MLISMSTINWLNQKYGRKVISQDEIWKNYTLPDLKGAKMLFQHDKESLLKSISGNSIKFISINIFDTLLLSPYTNKRDFFHHLG